MQLFSRTVQMQKNQTSETDDATGQTLSQGMRFYYSSMSPGLEITYPGTAAFSNGEGWKLEVFSGSLYIDDLYWEGGMTLDPDNRMLKKITIEDAVAADETFTVLMGDQVEPRKLFIQEHAKEAKNIDI